MLKSTHRATQQVAESPLPPAWTEHTAPTGHTYYYNTDTKQSTYTRPQVPSDEPLQIDYGATKPDLVVRASINAIDQFNRNNVEPDPRGTGHFTGGKSYQDRSSQRRQDNQGDRPKTKAAIPNCTPWVLVKTKLGRRFVHNTETKQSLWKFPSDVMMAVIDMDRMEWEAKKNAEAQNEQQNNRPDEPAAQERQHDQVRHEDNDSDSYEEVEVTDDEDGEAKGTDDPAAKRPRFSEDNGTGTTPAGPVEFDEDDIAWQLAQMEDDDIDTNDAYHEDNNNEGDTEEGFDVDRNDDDQGLPLTDTDSIALFRSLLDDSNISPFSTFDRLIENLSIVEDPRYTALPTVSRRREEFTSWSRDRIAEQKAQQENQLSDPTSPSTTRQPPMSAKSNYLSFLHDNATPKLYWPEFKRKYRKHPALVATDKTLPEKDKEKLYREYISKITKTSEPDRRKAFLGMLKEFQKLKKLDEVGKLLKDGRGGERQKVEELNWPFDMTQDIRWILVAKEKRNELIEEFFRTL